MYQIKTSTVVIFLNFISMETIYYENNSIKFSPVVYELPRVLPFYTVFKRYTYSKRLVNFER